MTLCLIPLALACALAPGFALADETAPPQPSPPSMLEPAKPLLNTYSAGLRACYGWPSSAGVFWCRFDLFVDWWRKEKR